MRALVHLARFEAAIRQELIMLVLAVPVALLIAPSVLVASLLIASILIVLLVEVLNTAIEAVCDAQTTQYDENIRIAKDAGSLAVLIACLLSGSFWLYVSINFLFSL